MVATSELVDKPVKSSKIVNEERNIELERLKVSRNQMKFPWKASFHCPHCNTPINANVAMEFEGTKIYVAALQARESKVRQVWQSQFEWSNWVGPNGKNQNEKGYMVDDQNDKVKRRFGKKRVKGAVTMGRTQKDNTNGRVIRKDTHGEKKGNRRWRLIMPGAHSHAWIRVLLLTRPKVKHQALRKWKKLRNWCRLIAEKKTFLSYDLTKRNWPRKLRKEVMKMSNLS